MGSILTNGVFLPAEGERNCYEGLAANWVALDGMIGGYSAHAANLTIHVTAADKEAWNGKADASALTAHTGDTTIHVTAADKEAWNGKADASALTAHTGDTTIHVTAADKEAWNGKQDALSQTQLDAVNSGIDSTKVQQIATNTSDISSLQSGKANDSNVVHKSGNETISGNKTFSSINGINPGALSLPNGNAQDTSWIGDLTIKDGSGYNLKTFTLNGWITINIPNTAGNLVVVNNGCGQIVTNEANGITGNNCAVFIPVVANVQISILLVLQTGESVKTAIFAPCLGNV